MKKKRLDEILLGKGWVKDKNEAFIVVTEGRVFVEGQKAVSPAQPVNPEAKIEVKGERKYVGRGAYKLEAALEKFHLDVRGKVCADIGAAIGGFTEVLLKHGAAKVYAIDTAKGKLALKLRKDPRVIVMEDTDVRDLTLLPDPIACATIDVSLIPLEQILSQLKSGRFLADTGEVIALLKPQYETRDPKVLRRGIVKNTRDRRKIFEGMLRAARDDGWEVRDWMESPIRGSEGNVEYLLHLRKV